MNGKTRRLTLWGLMTAISLALSVAESAIVPAALFPVPGFRLGFANIAILISVYIFGAFPSIGIVLIRTLSVFAFSGNPTVFLFSLCGGLAAVSVMLALHRIRRFSIFGVSAGGAAAHSVGQIAVAIPIAGNVSVIGYLPALLWASIAAGLLIALISVPVYRAVVTFFRFRPGQ
ncbi:MAG: Gx transporter family protein [Clostridiaceae bacterium]|nr:Gx transporter family protein [Clostridiaceae bacterium]